VHLPLDAELGSSDEFVRLRSVEKCRKVIHLTQPLRPFGYLLQWKHSRILTNTFGTSYNAGACPRVWTSDTF